MIACAEAAPVSKGFQWPRQNPLSDLRVQYGTKLGLAGLLALYCANVLRLEHSSWSILTVVVMMNSGIFIPRSIGSGSKPESTDHGFGLLRPDDREKMEQIISERSDGSYGAPALHGMLTASVIGPKPVPMDWILPTVLSPPESEAIGFDNFFRIQLGGGENRGVGSSHRMGVSGRS